MATSQQLDPKRKIELGQFFTPPMLANFMASLLQCSDETIRLLDAGAGIGSLCGAVVTELCRRPVRPRNLVITAYELDESLIPQLEATLDLCRRLCQDCDIQFASTIHQTDFIEHAASVLLPCILSGEPIPLINCAIVNPPYVKIHSQSHTRKLLRQLGIETANLYSGFLAVAMLLLQPGGELVAVTPRSFCNGPYFTTFRRLLVETMTIKQLHLFESRHHTFPDDGVLQETIITHALKESWASDTVTISVSKQPGMLPVQKQEIERNRVVHPDDPRLVIHIPTDPQADVIEDMVSHLQSSLSALGLSVSTGRVVSFRAKEELREKPEPDSVPLIGAMHFAGGLISWPKPNGRKPNAIAMTTRTKQLTLPAGSYVLVKRFSAKEARRRIVAALAGNHLGGYSSIAFENHVNYIHSNGTGLNEVIAKGLAAYLNSSLVDAYFRQFSGHTQVNATDLRALPYPDACQLFTLGSKIGALFPSQDDLDILVNQELFPECIVDINFTDEVTELRRSLDGASDDRD